MIRAVAWVGLTLIGFVLATGLHFPGTLDNVGWEVGPMVLGAVTGIAIGALQLPVLRGLVRPLWLWPLATAAGIAVTHALGDGVSPGVGYVPVALIGGAATGALQAALLRSPLWAAATTLAFVVGIVGGRAIGVALGLRLADEDGLLGAAILSIGTGAIYAALTVPLLIRKWADPRPVGDRKR